MTTEHTRSDVAVFIDFENVYVSVREKLDATPNFESMMDYCNDLGRVVIARAYADWYRYPRITSALYANGIEPMYVPTYYYDKDMGRTGRAIKNSVDMNLCVDAMKTLYLNQNIGKFVLATGDRDFIPLVNSIRQQGKEVIIIGIGGAASTHLGQSADEFIFYEQLVGDTSTVSTRKTKSVRSPVPALTTAVVSVVPPKIEPELEPDIYDTLVEAVHLVRERGYLSTLGSLKLVMKELMGGDFKENRYKDINGKHFAKFKDFVIDAEKRNKVQIYTNGTVSEVFLPGEDARKLSQFAELKEEPPVLEESRSPSTNGNREQASSPPPTQQQSSTSSNRSRRRRRPRGQRQETTQPTIEELPPVGTNNTEHIFSGEDIIALENPFSPEDVLSAELVDLDHDVPDVYESLLEQSLSDDRKRYSEGIGKKFIEGQLFPLENETSLLFNVDEALTLSQMTDHPHDLVEIASVPLDDTSFPEPTKTNTVECQESEVASVDDILEAEDAAAILLSLVDNNESSNKKVSPFREKEQDPDSEDFSDGDTSGSQTKQEDNVSFSSEEWQAFRKMMTTFSKAVSFAQIFDSLRNLRQQQQIVRTNEQLRHLVKQAINNGMLERSGRGKRVYYTLKQQNTQAEEKNDR